MVIETAAIVSAAAPLVKTLIEKLVTPKLDIFTGWCKSKYKEVMIPTAEHFQEYLERAYEKYSTINTLVFHNSQRKLKDIYVAQSIVKENQFGDDSNAVLIDSLPIELIKEYKKILITDTAGMGKSTIMKRMFIDLIDNSLADVGIPIYIELNRLDKEHNILTEIREELNSLSEEFDNELLLKLIQTGGFIFFMDGYDEISIKDRNEVSIDIHSFISKAGNNNYFIITSRPESGLASFGAFQSFNIKPLEKEEAFRLLVKYDMSKNKELSRKLITLLKSGEYKSVEEYLINPLLTSLLFTAYDYNRSIPFEKHRFYGLVFEAYFEKHDLSKPIKSRAKHSGLNHDGFDNILRYVGYKSLTNIGVKFDEDTILNTIREAKDSNRNLVFSEHNFLKDLTTNVPLFCREGSEYKWVHKSLLEYFAARFIYCDAKEHQNSILSAIYNSKHIEKYINMLDIYYDIDYNGFAKNILLPACEKYIKFYGDIINTAAIYKWGIDRRLIEERIEQLFIQDFALCYEFDQFGHDGYDMLRYRFPRHDIMVFDTEVGGRFFASNSKIDILIKLLFRKKRTLFTIIDLTPVNYGEIIKKLTDGLENNEVSLITIEFGNESEELYETINDFINYVRPWRLDFESCKNEINRIREEVAKNSNLSDLLNGI